MARKRSWKITFKDGQVVTIRATSTRMAKAQACVDNSKPWDEIQSHEKIGPVRSLAPSSYLGAWGYQFGRRVW